MDYIIDPDLAHTLSEITTDYKIKLMRMAIEACADAIVSGDDYAGTEAPFMSSTHFREFILPLSQTQYRCSPRSGRAVYQTYRRKHLANPGDDD